VKNLLKKKHLLILSSVSLTVLLLCFFVFIENINDRDTKYFFRNSNIILIIVDTLRADHLPFYGYERNTAPYISNFSRAAILFENTIATSSWTKASVASILSGLYPKSHGAMTREDILNKDLKILPEILKENGYYTYAFIANGNANEKFGFNQGYNFFHFMPGDKLPYAYSNELNRSLIPFIKNEIREPFFLLIHYNDPHEPHFPPESSRKYSINNTHAPSLNSFISEFKGDLKKATKEIINYYDDSILFNDSSIKIIMDILNEKNFFKGSIIIIVSDHGQEFYEHNKLYHGQSLYDESIRVPFLIKLPNIEHKRINNIVSLIDISPTILELLGLKIPRNMQGISLFRSKKLERRKEVYSELKLDKYESYSIRTLEQKYYYQILPSVAPQFYNLVNDPKEINNLFDASSMLLKEKNLIKKLVNWRKTNIYNGPRNKNLDEEQIRILKTLGYIK